MVVKGIRFLEVLDVDSVGLVFPRILDPEEEPLGIAVCVVIWLQIEIIFVISNLLSQPEIATLKPRFKYEGFIRRVSHPVVGIQIRIIVHPTIRGDFF